MEYHYEIYYNTESRMIIILRLYSFHESNVLYISHLGIIENPPLATFLIFNY
jgi:hypothetical protein